MAQEVDGVAVVERTEMQGEQAGVKVVENHRPLQIPRGLEPAQSRDPYC